MPEGQQPWKRGLSLLQEGKSQEAADLLWRAATEDPGSFETRLYLGLALAQLQRHQEAATELRAALSINPQSALAQYNLGVVLQSAGRHREALTAYEAALAIDPGYEQASQAAEGLRAALGPAAPAPAAAAPAAPPGAYPTPPAAPARREGGMGRGIVWVVVAAIAAVLVAITLVLAAILFPVFARAREKARQASCLSNLKQLALGQMMYVQDYDLMLPPADTWCDATMVYIQNQGVYACPAAPESQWSYAMNSDLSGAILEEIADPNQTVLLYDSTAEANNANDALTSIPVPGRHSRGNNFAFADGHARWYSDSASPGSAEPFVEMEPPIIEEIPEEVE